MLVLSRKMGEQIQVGDHIKVVVHRIHGGRVTIGIEAPADVKILRGEVSPNAREHSRIDVAVPNSDRSDGVDERRSHTGGVSRVATL